MLISVRGNNVVEHTDSRRSFSRRSSGLQDCVSCQLQMRKLALREHLLSIQIVVPSDILNKGGIVDKINPRILLQFSSLLMQQSKRIWVTSEPRDNGHISHLERLDISNISFKDMHVCSAQFGEFLGVCLAANECKHCILQNSNSVDERIRTMYINT